MKIMMNRASFARSSMLANWHGQSPQTDEQRRAMFARLGAGGGRNAVPASASTSRLYPENPPEKPKDPRGEIRSENWQDRLRKVVDAAGRIGYVGEPDSGDPTWKYALATAAGLLLPFPGGKVKTAGKVADAVAEASTAIKQARSLQAQAIRLRRLAAKTADPTEQSWLLEMAQRFSGWSDDLLGAKPYSIADESLLKVAEKAGKPSFQEITKAQIPLLKKAGITSDEDLVLYSLSSVADGQVLRETTEAVLTGKMTEAEAVAKLKSDFAKLKIEKAKSVTRMEDLSPAEQAEYKAWSDSIERQGRDPLPADFGLTESGSASRTADPLSAEGWDAFADGADLADNPYPEGSDGFNAWRIGWKKANLEGRSAPRIDYGLSPEEAFNPFGTDDDYLAYRAANPRSRFMLNYAYRPVLLRNAFMSDNQRKAFFASKGGATRGDGSGQVGTAAELGLNSNQVMGSNSYRSPSALPQAAQDMLSMAAYNEQVLSITTKMNQALARIPSDNRPSSVQAQRQIRADAQAQIDQLPPPSALSPLEAGTGQMPLPGSPELDAAIRAGTVQDPDAVIAQLQQQQAALQAQQAALQSANQQARRQSNAALVSAGVRRVEEMQESLWSRLPDRPIKTDYAGHGDPERTADLGGESKDVHRDYSQDYYNAVQAEKLAKRKRARIGVDGSIAEQGVRAQSERLRAQARARGYYPNRRTFASLLANAWVAQPKPTAASRAPARKPFQWPAGLNVSGNLYDYMKGMMALGQYNGLSGQSLIDFLKTKYAEGSAIFSSNSTATPQAVQSPGEVQQAPNPAEEIMPIPMPPDQTARAR